jgi:hypothetical protein
VFRQILNHVTVTVTVTVTVITCSMLPCTPKPKSHLGGQPVGERITPETNQPGECDVPAVTTPQANGIPPETNIQQTNDLARHTCHIAVTDQMSGVSASLSWQSAGEIASLINQTEKCKSSEHQCSHTRRKARQRTRTLIGCLLGLHQHHDPQPQHT